MAREEDLKKELDNRFPPKQYLPYNDYLVMRDMICQLQLEVEHKDGIIAGLKAREAKKDARIKLFAEGNTRLANVAPLSDVDIASDLALDDDANYTDYTDDDDTGAEKEPNRRRSSRQAASSTSAVTCSLVNLQPGAPKTKKRKNNK